MRYQAVTLFEGTHEQMVAFCEALKMVLPLANPGVKIVSTTVAESVKTLYDQPRQQPTEQSK
jgi:hypothetical protein